MPRLEFINSEIKGGSRIFQGDPAEFQTKKYIQVSNSSIIYCWDKYPYANSFVFEKREIRIWTRLKVWSTPKICGTRVPQNAIVLQGRPRPYSIIILNMHFIPKASLRASSQITASSYILERHLWVNNSKPLTLAPTWSLARKQTDCITTGMSKLSDLKLVLTPSKHNFFHDFIQCWTNVENVGPTLYKFHTNVLCLLSRRTFSQTLYIFPMLVPAMGQRRRRWTNSKTAFGECLVGVVSIVL